MYPDGVRPISKEEVERMQRARPKVSSISREDVQPPREVIRLQTNKHPIVREATFRDGMEYARSLMSEATAEITDPEACRILTLAFQRLNSEINRYAGKIVTGDRIDYLERVQLKARQAWVDGRMSQTTKAAVSSVTTPLGALTCETWMEAGKDRWQSVYTLHGEPITVREVKALGLAQRPTKRERKK